MMSGGQIPLLFPTINETLDRETCKNVPGRRVRVHWITTVLVLLVIVIVGVFPIAEGEPSWIRLHCTLLVVYVME